MSPKVSWYNMCVTEPDGQMSPPPRLRTVSPAIRGEIRRSPDSIRALAARYGINPKTVAKWKARPSPEDFARGPAQPAPRALTAAEEAMCVGFRKHAMLPLDDCLYALQFKLPHLSRSTLHRLLRRHGVGRLPERPASALGDFYIDAAAIRTGTGFPHIFIAFDRSSRFAFADIFEREHPGNGAEFLARLIAAVPYRIHAVLTGAGPQFHGPTVPPPRTPVHPFVRLCREESIAHSLLAPDDPWSIGHYDAGPAARRAPRSPPGPAPAYADPGALADHFLSFFDTYNFSRRLKTLNGRTPYEHICEVWRQTPRIFRVSPERHLPRMVNMRQEPPSGDARSFTQP